MMNAKTFRASSHEITELSERYSIDRHEASSLKNALYKFHILSRTDLTTAEMAGELGISVDLTRRYRGILGRFGLVERGVNISSEITRLCEQYHIDRKIAYALKRAMMYLDVLSRSDLTYAQMADQIGCNTSTINNYRSVLIKAGLVTSKNQSHTLSSDELEKATELRRRGYTKSKIESELHLPESAAENIDRQFPHLRAVMAVKKLTNATSTGTRIISFNSRELKATHMDPKKEYYTVIHPFSLQFYLRVFGSRDDACDYIFSRHFDISKFDELVEGVLDTPHTIPSDVIRRILELRRRGIPLIQISRTVGRNMSTVSDYAEHLPGSKDLKHLKKLIALSRGQRIVSFNVDELQRAGMDPKREYFGVVEPDDMDFLLQIFESREQACEYAIGKHSIVELYRN